MPRFFFDIHNAVHERDDEGVELANEAAARREAVKSLRSIASDDVRQGVYPKSLWIDIRDAGNRTVAHVDLAEAVILR